MFRCGGIQDRFDLIIPPGKIAKILTGLMELVPISVLKEQVGSSVGTVIVRKHGHRGFERKTFRTWTQLSMKGLKV
jgi:hypothetical protein